MYTLKALFLVIALLLHEGSSEDSGVSSRVCEDEKECENKDCGKDNHHKEEKTIVCYFTNWAVYRQGQAKFTPKDIDPTLCTQINYAFAILDPETLTIVPSDKWADVHEKFFELVAAFNKKGPKVLLSIGGADDSAGDKWSRLIRNQEAHGIFVNSVLDILHQYNFDGLDLEYAYPGCPRGNLEEGQPTDNDNFNKLMSDLKNAFKGKYTLAVAAAKLKDTIDKCYKMADLCEIADQVNIMAYNYHGMEKDKTGANAPMFASSAGWGVFDTVKYYVDEVKCPPEKILLGIPYYGITYTLADKSEPGFGVAFTKSGEPGRQTGMTGAAAYYETCLLLKKEGWQYGFDKVRGSSAWHDDQFISMPSQADVIRKSCLIRHFNLKGANIWTIDYDDFNDLCGCGSYPLLKTLNRELRCQDIPRPHCC